MNNKGSNVFDQIRADAGNNDVSAALEKLVANLTEKRLYHPLFEAIKLQTRHRLNLPLLFDQRREKLDSKIQSELESGLLEACRTVGLLLVADQKLGEAWVYLQPLDDRALFESLLEKYKVIDDNADEVIDVALMQMAAPATGFRLVLERYGTCDGISTFESLAHTFDAEYRTQLSEILVDHLHSELIENLKNHLSQNKPTHLTDDLSLENLIRNRDKILTDAGPLVDATHLASTMRIGRSVNSRERQLQLCEMAQYGCLLDESYQFEGDSPFENTFADHLTYYRALVADSIDANEVTQAIEFFDNKSKASADDPFNPVADEVFVDLLFRLGHSSQAIQASLDRLANRAELAGIAPSVHQMATRPEHFQMLQSHFQERDDLLGFTISVLNPPSQ